MIAGTLGPIISVILFLLHHNTWDPLALRNVFLVGISLEIFAGACMLCFRDSCALEEEDAANGESANAASSNGGASSSTSTAAVTAADRAVAGAAVGGAAGGAVVGDGDNGLASWCVPRILFVSGLLYGLASGMTIKFFPLYFRCTCRMSPAAVQAIFAAQPLSLAIFSRVATCCARRIGRAQVLILSKLIGVSLLVAMALLEGWLLAGVSPRSPNATATAGLDGGHSWGLLVTSEHEDMQCAHLAPSEISYSSWLMTWQPSGNGDDFGFDGEAHLLARPPLLKVIAIIGIYMLRTALMNCTYPLSASLMMDSVPKNQRARWQSLGSISRFGWCGSAALGGVLADRYGYASTFLVTAGMQASGIVVQLALLPIVPRSERPRADVARADAARTPSEPNTPSSACSVGSATGSVQAR